MGGNYTVLHHTQLLNRLIRDKKLVPVKSVDGGSTGQDITYHDPCYLGRHNKVYEAPRELIGASGAKLTEMPRHADRGLCCGAGGARMWMEEHIGKRVNVERVEEAMDTGAGTIATGCPFCRVMITDGVDDVAAANDATEGRGEGRRAAAAGVARHQHSHPARKGHRGQGSRKSSRGTRRPRSRRPRPPKRHRQRPRTEAKPEPAAQATSTSGTADTKPVTGLGIAAAKRPGAKKARFRRASRRPAAAAPPAEAPAGPAKAERRRSRTTRQGPRQPQAKRPGTPRRRAAPATPAGNRRPRLSRGRAELPSPRHRPNPPSPSPRSRASASRPVPDDPAPRRRHRQHRLPSLIRHSPNRNPMANPAQLPNLPADGNGEAPSAPVKGLGIAKGARPPGKR